jgi:hypothetical protein
VRLLPSTRTVTELFEISIFPKGQLPRAEPTWARPRFE